MAVQKKVRAHKQETQTEEAVESAPQEKKSPEDLKAEIDDLLDQIEGVLEENAQEFVEGFVQKGGE